MIINLHHKRFRSLIAVLLGLFIEPGIAGVLSEDRADTMYHYYDGGGVQITGPSVLVRKKFKESVSLYGNYYVDSISSASIDVITSGASAYTEERTEMTLGADYLHDDTTMSMSFTNSSENDYEADSLNLGISQEVFGGMTTLGMGYGRGSDVVGMRGDSAFAEDVDRRNYRLSVSQVITRNMLLGVFYEAIADEGHLNNPYRSYRYVDPDNPTNYLWRTEVYPNTRSSNAVSMKSRYYLSPGAAAYGGFRFYTDTWGIDAYNFDVGYSQPLRQAWILDLNYRFYSQEHANFYADLFPYEDAQNFLGRDKELSTFISHTIRFGVTYNFLQDGWQFLDKGTVNFFYDRVMYDYKDFRDLTQLDENGVALPAGQEPFYEFSADIIQVLFSFWF
jgi:hypothetical protein